MAELENGSFKSASRSVSIICVTSDSRVCIGPSISKARNCPFTIVAVMMCPLKLTRCLNFGVCVNFQAPDSSSSTYLVVSVFVMSAGDNRVGETSN